jgi:hypothetical protein
MTFAAGIVGALLGIVVFSYAADFPPFATTHALARHGHQ